MTDEARDNAASFTANEELWNAWTALFAGGRWGTPVKLSTRGGALTCRGIEAVTTSIEHAIEAGND